MTGCRYDFIYATADVGVDNVIYEFDESIRAVSDHALVIADLVVQCRLANTPLQPTGFAGG
jgi:hypothetical protein